MITDTSCCRALALSAAEHLPGFAALPHEGPATKLAGRVEGYEQEVTVYLHRHWKNRRVIVSGYYYYTCGESKMYFGPSESESPRTTVAADCSPRRLARAIARLLPEVARVDRESRARLMGHEARANGLQASVDAINAQPVRYQCDARDRATAWIETAGGDSIDLQATSDGVRIHVTLPANQLTEAVAALLAIKNNPK